MRRWKTTLLFLVFFSLAGLITFRLYYLQIKKGEYFEALALGQQTSFEEVSGDRGGIFFDKSKLPLAQTKDEYIVYISPQKMSADSKEYILGTLAGDLGETKESLLKLLENGRVIKKEISLEAFKKIKSRRLKGIYPEKTWKRVYPQGELSSFTIGFVNQAGQGQYGVEESYDDILKGEKYLKKNSRSVLGYFKNSASQDPIFNSSLEGADIYLTLNYKLQYFSEKILREAKEKWHIDSGQILISEPGTGKILTLAALPNFDPNKYYKEKDVSSFINPITQKLFEPGSIFKPITFAAGLEQNLITPEDTYIDKGFVKLNGQPIYNFQKRAWGKRTMTDVLEESINTGAVFVEQKLGPKVFLDYLKRFGLFEKTGIDLNGEAFSANNTLKRGRERDIAVASFGQGINLTPIQLIRAFGAIANNGKLMKPFIVEKIKKSNGEAIETKLEVDRTVMSPSTCEQLTSMLTKVVEKGSGQRARIKGYSIAGKTGTAQVPLKRGGYSEDKTIQSFIGFFPAKKPEFLILIKLDNPKNSPMAGHSVGPLFRELTKYIIDTYQIPPDE